MTAPPAGRVPRRETRVADAAGVHAPRRPHTSLCLGAAVQVRRSPPAAAGRPRDGDARGRPARRRPAGQADAGATAPAAQTGTPGPRTRRAPQRPAGPGARPVGADEARARPPEAAGAFAPAADAARGQAWTAGGRPPRPRAPDTGGSAARRPTAWRGRADQATAEQAPRGRDRSGGRHVARRGDGGGPRPQEAARGGAGVTWPASAETRPAPVEALGERRQPPRDRATWRRRRALPTGTGHDRPCGLPVGDATCLQAAGARLRTAIAAPAWRAWRAGDRPGRGAGEAVRDRPCARPDGREGEVGEADRPGVFDHRDPDGRRPRRRGRRADRAVRGRIRTWRSAGVRETAGWAVPPDTGAPPGGGSPGCAHVEWPSAVDRWWATVVTPPCRGAAGISRAADDGVGAWRVRREAAWVSQGRPTRRGPCTRAGSPAKTRLRVNGLTARLRGPDRAEGGQGHSGALALRCLGHGRRLPGAPAAWRAPTACPRGARHPDPGRQPPRAPPPDRGAASPHVRLRVRLARPRVHPRHRRRAHGTSGSVRGAPGHRGVPTAEASTITPRYALCVKGPERSCLMSLQRQPKLTPEEYLALERTAECKSEYFAGEIFAMAGASERHVSIVANTMYLLVGRAQRPPVQSLCE